jgi:hypothetical protein
MNEEKLARICWNDYGWVRPSGWYGKSKDKKSYEGSHGFGHEEWLFDVEKIIDGYHYGFLQPIGKYYEKYIGKTFNISLFSFHNDKHEFYWVGKLNNVEVITKKEAKRVISIYKKNGWWKELKEDLVREGVKGDNYDILDYPESYFNIRYKPAEIKNILEEPCPFDNDGIIPAFRYTLYDYDADRPKPIIKDFKKGYDFKSGSDTIRGYKKKAKKRSRQEEKELELEHNVMIEKFFTYLQKKYPKDKVRIECKAYGHSRIDVVRRTSKGDVFYEIKTYNHPRISVRSAIGQLLEYAFFPDVENAIQLSIVTPKPANKDVESYIRKLNIVLNLPLTYIHFDYNKIEILKEIGK